MRYINAKTAIGFISTMKDVMDADSIIRYLGTMKDSVEITKCGSCVYYVNGCCIENKKALPVIHDKDDFCKNGKELL